MSIEIYHNFNASQDSVATTTTIMSEENDETWYDTDEEYNLWHNAAETIDNYQEWADPLTVLGDMDQTDPVNKHIEPHIHEGEYHTGSLK